MRANAGTGAEAVTWLMGGLVLQTRRAEQAGSALGGRRGVQEGKQDGVHQVGLPVEGVVAAVRDDEELSVGQGAVQLERVFGTNLVVVSGDDEGGRANARQLLGLHLEVEPHRLELVQKQRPMRRAIDEGL